MRVFIKTNIKYVEKMKMVKSTSKRKRNFMGICVAVEPMSNHTFMCVLSSSFRRRSISNAIQLLCNIFARCRNSAPKGNPLSEHPELNLKSMGRFRPFVSVVFILLFITCDIVGASALAKIHLKK